MRCVVFSGAGGNEVVGVEERPDPKPGRFEVLIEPRFSGVAYARSRTPYPRLGRPEDVAGAALSLACEDASYVSGVNLLVDGGWMAY